MIVDAYAMAFGGLLLVTGSLADRLGRKRLFLAGFGVFTVGSLGAAFPSSVGVLIAWRAAMGLGAAMTIPAGLSILNHVFADPRQRARRSACGARRWASGSRSGRSPAACCCQGSGGDRCSSSTCRC